MTGHGSRRRTAPVRALPRPGRRTPTALVLAAVVLAPAVVVAPQALADDTTPPTPQPAAISTSSPPPSLPNTPNTPGTSSTPTPAPAADPGAVVIEGTPQVGRRLSAVTDGWDPDLTLTYAWTVDGAPITDATGPSYVLTAGELARRVAVVVTSHRDGTEVDRVTSGAVGPIAPGTFAQAPLPGVLGTLRVGRILTADTGTWEPDPTLGYQWRADGVAISGATSRTYVLQPGDRTKRISVTVIGRRDGYATVSRTSPLTAVVDWGLFATAPTPTVAGTPQIGSSVTVKPGTWSPAASYTYQWRIDGKNVTGQTNYWFYLDATRLGHDVSVVVTARRAGYLTVVRTSSARGPITRPFTTTVTPKIGGYFRRVGQVVTVSTGTWSPTATLSIQWRRDGAAISGATGTAYRPTTADLGQQLTVSVTGRRSTYTTTTRTSAATPAILPPPYGFTTAGTPATPPAAAYAPASITLFTDAQWDKIKTTGVWRADECPGYRTSFRRVEVPYWGFDGKTHRGWVNVNADVSSSTAKIFNTLYAKRFPLHRVEGIEMFGGRDWLASKGNVTTSFNCRVASEQNSPNGSSPHAWGRAIDLNPVQNPYINPHTGTWDPNAPYASSAPGTIRYGGTVWTLFTSYRWYWSGTDSWRDYMHFDTGYPSTSKPGYIITPDGDTLGRGPVPTEV